LGQQCGDCAVEPQGKARQAWTAAVPLLFVLLWSTGFIGARMGLPHAEPLTFLLLRFVAAAALLLPVAILTGAPWPRGWQRLGHVAVVGALIHGVYLGGVYVAIARGLPTALCALVVGLQPLLTAVAVGPLLGERVAVRQWLGLLLGMVGITLVLLDKRAVPGGSGLFQGFGLADVLIAALALVAITYGTIYQKRHCEGIDLTAGAVVQYAAAILVAGAGALAIESFSVTWTPAFAFALGWLVVVLSLGAVSLLMLMIRMGEVSRTASYFYLVPPVTAVTAYALFGEEFGWTAIVGFAAALAGVVLAVRR
jgi:drug/metabolite transporter (DMT)-like permease